MEMAVTGRTRAEALERLKELMWREVWSRELELPGVVYEELGGGVVRAGVDLRVFRRRRGRPPKVTDNGAVPPERMSPEELEREIACLTDRLVRCRLALDRKRGDLPGGRAVEFADFVRD